MPFVLQARIAADVQGQLRSVGEAGGDGDPGIGQAEILRSVLPAVRGIGAGTSCGFGSGIAVGIGPGITADENFLISEAGNRFPEERSLLVRDSPAFFVLRAQGTVLSAHQCPGILPPALHGDGDQFFRLTLGEHAPVLLLLGGLFLRAGKKDSRGNAAGE